jgi:hypothetical protein
VLIAWLLRKKRQCLGSPYLLWYEKGVVGRETWNSVSEISRERPVLFDLATFVKPYLAVIWYESSRYLLQLLSYKAMHVSD